MKIRIAAFALACTAIGAPSTATPFEQPTLRAMKDELARSIEKLEMPGSGKPYFLAYQLWELQRAHVIASFGAVVYSELVPQRYLDADLRVGDYTFDNSNFSDADRGRSVSLPVTDDYDAVRRELWLASDRQYKHAIEMLERKRAVAKAEVKAADEPAAFSKEAPSHIIDDRAVAQPDLKALEALAKKLSASFRTNPEIYSGSVEITATAGKHYFVSSEGSESMQTLAFVKLEVECSSQADDGMPVHDGFVIWVPTADQLPPEAELVAQVEAVSKELSALRKAPIADDYAGPILFTGVAAGEVVRALLGENLSGTPAPKGDRPGARSMGESELAGKVNQRILPLGVSLVDDPGASRAGKTALIGGTRFDEEGVPAQRVAVVENGTLKRFLMSRAPRKGFEHSNGHAASTPYTPMRAHPTNLILASTAGVADAELRRRALAATKQQSLGYYLVVDKLAQRHYRDEVDAAMTGEATIPHAAVVRRVYLDGHEELVRGVTFGAVPIKSLKDLLAIGKTPTVHSYLSSGLAGRLAYGDSASGYLGSIAAPALLFHDLDVKKPLGAQKQPPIAPRPK